MKRLLFGFSVLLISIGFSGCGSDEDIVKDGVMNFNETLTVGQALDNWKNCESSKWEKFETINGIKIIQFTCTEKNPIDDIKSFTSLIPKRVMTNKEITAFSKEANRKNWQFNKDYNDYTGTIEEYTEHRLQGFKKAINEENLKLENLKHGACTNIDKIQDVFQFSINKDDSFQIDNVQYEIIWTDGKKSTTPVDSIGRLKFAYQNGIDTSFITNNKDQALNNIETICYKMYRRAK